MGIITFSLAAILSLPKQFVTVYLGVLLEGAGSAYSLFRPRICTMELTIFHFLLRLAAAVS